MKRKDLLDMLSMVRPALGSLTTLSPIFTHYCFDGKRLMAYDGARLGISLPFASDLKGGVPGRTFDDLLTRSGSEEVQLSMVKASKGPARNVEIKAGKAVMTLATIPADDQVVVFQKEFLAVKGDTVPVDGKALLRAISCCLNSVGDETRIENSGLLFRVDRGFLVIYGFDNVSFSVAELPLDGDLSLPNDGVLVPGAFCKQMVQYLKGDDECRFAIGERYAVFTAGKLNVYGTLIPRPTKIDFDRILDNNFPQSDSRKPVVIPDGLKEALGRACVIVNTKLDNQLRTEIVVEGGTARLFSRSGRGEVEDLVELTKHPDATLAIDPRPVLDGLHFFDTADDPGKVLFTHRCAVLCRDGQTYMVAAFQPDRAG